MGIVRDLKYAVRVLVKSPGFSLAAIVTIALGISVNSTVFTLANGVFFAELPFENPEEVAYIRTTRGISYPDFMDISEQSRTMALPAYEGLGADLSDGVSAPERVSGASITANTFSLLGQQALIGRDFTPADEKAGAEPVARVRWFVVAGVDSKIETVISVMSNSVATLMLSSPATRMSW